MDGVARLPAGDRRALFTETASRAGISAIIAEKDFWVCWSLGRLYGIRDMPALLFKGGTSLSKCFQLIERFSEDIDLGLRREDIGLGGDSEPTSDMGSTRLKRARKAILEGGQEFVAERFLPMVREDFRQVLGGSFELRLSATDTESVVDFHYPRALEAAVYGAGAYIATVVRVEIGARSDHFPTEDVEISPYASEHFPDEFTSPRSRVVAQAPVRTLLEKALILHTDLARQKIATRSSRHAYDLAMMHRAGTTASLTRELFEEVARHKRVFSGDQHAGAAPDEGLRMVPGADLLAALDQDYRSMNEMFFRDPPPFTEVVEDLRSVESAINSLPRGVPR